MESMHALSRLNTVLQLNQVWIRSALHAADGPELSALLRCFLTELEEMEAEARHIAIQRGWEPEPLSPVSFFRNSRRFLRQDTNACVAGQLILLFTKTRVQILQHTSRDVRSYAVSTLSLKLTDTYALRLRQLERFL